MGQETLGGYYDTMLTNLAQASASESAMAEGFAGYRDSLSSQREQFSGVSLDEETIKIMQFQHAYQASARMISTIDELFTTLLNL